MTLAADGLGFWDVFWLLLIFIPLLLIWSFALADIFRREDLNGWLRAFWVIIVVLIPFFGTLIYLLFRPRGTAGQAPPGQAPRIW